MIGKHTSSTKKYNNQAMLKDKKVKARSKEFDLLSSQQREKKQIEHERVSKNQNSPIKLHKNVSPNSRKRQ